MTLTKDDKSKLIRDFARGPQDVGSPEVQIAILTKRINALTGHLSGNKRDHSTRRGLLAMVSRRRRLLDFLRSVNPDKYVEMLSRLGIRK
jgi:small subunit ribosomal protein S15